jgi:hypothetical protein
VAFLGVGYGTTFYDLFGHLAALGVAPELRGVVVGATSLTAMVLYLLASPFVSARTAPRAMQAGLAVLALCGLSYLVVTSSWGLLLVRAATGAGQFLVGAGTMALLVRVIPADRSGQAFGVYSVAILAAYGIVPAAMDAVRPLLRSAAQGYAAAGLALLPAAWIVRGIGRRMPPADAGSEGHLPSWADIRTSLMRPPIAMLLLLNASYFANWSSLYFLFKGFAEARGIGNVGVFFGVLTAVMIAIRLLAGRLFDRFDKAWLAALAFGIIASGHVALDRLPAGAVPLVGAFVGLGLGGAYPALNGLAFEHSTPRLRPLSANLMLFALQGGSFLGPAIGGALVARHGYPGYFHAATGLALASAALSVVLARGPGAGSPTGARPPPQGLEGRGSGSRRPGGPQAREHLAILLPDHRVGELALPEAGEARDDAPAEAALREEVGLGRGEPVGAPGRLREGLQGPGQVAAVRDVPDLVDVTVADVQDPLGVGAIGLRHRRRRGGEDVFGPGAEALLEDPVRADRTARLEVDDQPVGQRPSRGRAVWPADVEVAEREEPLDARGPGLDLDHVPGADGGLDLQPLAREDPGEPAALHRVQPAGHLVGVVAGDLLEVAGEGRRREEAEGVHLVAVHGEGLGPGDSLHRARAYPRRSRQATPSATAGSGEPDPGAKGRARPRIRWATPAIPARSPGSGGVV